MYIHTNVIHHRSTHKSAGRGAYRAQPARVVRPGLAPQSLAPVEKGRGRDGRGRGPSRRPAPQPTAVPPLPPAARSSSGVGGPPEPRASIPRRRVRDGPLGRGAVQVASASALAGARSLAVGVPRRGDRRGQEAGCSRQEARGGEAAGVRGGSVKTEKARKRLASSGAVGLGRAPGGGGGRGEGGARGPSGARGCAAVEEATARRRVEGVEGAAGPAAAARGGGRRDVVPDGTDGFPGEAGAAAEAGRRGAAHGFGRGAVEQVRCLPGARWAGLGRAVFSANFRLGKGWVGAWYCRIRWHPTPKYWLLALFFALRWCTTHASYI